MVNVSKLPLDDHAALVAGTLNIPISVINSDEFRALLEYASKDRQRNSTSIHYPVHDSRTITSKMI